MESITPVFPTGAVFIFNMIAVAPALPFARIDGHREGDCSAAAAPRLCITAMFNDPASASGSTLSETLFQCASIVQPIIVHPNAGAAVTGANTLRYLVDHNRRWGRNTRCADAARFLTLNEGVVVISVSGCAAGPVNTVCNARLI